MQLFEHQKRGVEFLTQKRKAILADDMGTGKSIQAITATLNLGKSGVVICPASLKINWAREILMVDENANILIANGKKIYIYHEGKGSGWLIINYDIVGRENVQKEIAECYMPTTLILDESHYIKNSRSIRTKKTLAIAKNATNVFLLTGTPIMNRPMELFTQLKAIDHSLSDNWYGYAKTYCGAFRQTLKDGRSFLNVGGATNLDRLSKNISDAYLRRTKEVLGDKLPEKIISNIKVEISPEFRKKYESAWDDYIAFVEKEVENEDLENIKLARHIIELNKLKQVASAGKIEHIIEATENVVEQGDKVIIFTQYTNTLRTIKQALTGKRIKVVSLSGEDDINARQASVDAFQTDKNVKVFIANIKAGGVGITLTEANKVFFADMEWTPALHDQAESRAHRYTQTRLVNVYYYIAKDTVDEDIVKLLKKKAQIIQKIMKGEKTISRDITKDLIREIGQRRIINI